MGESWHPALEYAREAARLAAAPESGTILHRYQVKSVIGPNGPQEEVFKWVIDTSRNPPVAVQRHVREGILDHNGEPLAGRIRTMHLLDQPGALQRRLADPPTPQYPNIIDDYE